MTKQREKTREELTAEIEDGQKKIRQFENQEKMLRQKLSKEERRTRSRRASSACLNQRASAGISEKTSRGRGKLA